MDDLVLVQVGQTLQTDTRVFISTGTGRVRPHCEDKTTDPRQTDLKSFCRHFLASVTSCRRHDEDGLSWCSHPEDLPADVGDPLLLQRVPFGVFDQIRYRAGTTELHHQLQTHRKHHYCSDCHMFFFSAELQGSRCAEPDRLEE